MAHQKWHMSYEEGTLTLSRGRSDQLDFYARTVIAGGANLRKSRIAHQVRQDMWRSLQVLRGFSPVIQVRAINDDLEITAGGQVQGQFPRQRSQDAVAQVLECPDRRARWVRSAQRKA